MKHNYLCNFFIAILRQDEGVMFQLGATSHTFRGTITLVTGDNLGSQYIGGYKQLASALRKCRYCMAISNDMKQKVHMFILRQLYLHIKYAV